MPGTGTPAVVGVDVGGSVIKAGVLAGSRLVATRERATPGESADRGGAVVDVVADLVRDLVGDPGTSGPPAAIGLVVPGVVDSDAGVARHAENLGWRDVPFRSLVAERTGLPVAFGHDVRAGALAEARLGAGAGHGDVLFLPVGTGIAAGLVLDGVLHDRSRPVGELGHVDVGHGEPCRCGLSGCLEAVASASAIARRYAARTGTPATAAEVAASVTAGDPDAGAVWHDAVTGLAAAVAWVAAVLAPDVVVVGGGVARAGDLLLAPLRAEVERRLSFHHRPEIVAARLGDRAGCVGAGLLALRLLGPRP